ncbi:MAG: DUF2480 family protein [Flavobacteriaceae bacterium]|nr:DUF2480 family protein [Flavobacteriaceae bacterium]
MEEQIVNRVKSSKLITIDLQELNPKNPRSEFDISILLDNGMILREKEFREKVKNFNWDQFSNHYVAIVCKTNAIIPAWAPLLICTYLSEFSKKFVLGTLEELENYILNEFISNLDLLEYKDKPIVIKGCSEKNIPDNALVQLIQRLQPVVKSIFYGEACSSVPLYKRRK